MNGRIGFLLVLIQKSPTTHHLKNQNLQDPEVFLEIDGHEAFLFLSLPLSCGLSMAENKSRYLAKILE